MNVPISIPKNSRFNRRDRLAVGLWAIFFISICFLSAELHLALTAGFMLIPLIGKNKLDLRAFYYIFPLAAIAVPATLITSVFGTFDWVAFKSFAYLVRIPIYLLFGYLFCPKERAAMKLLLAAIISGGFLAVYYIGDYMMIGEALSSRFDLRQTVGFGYAVWAPALCAAIYFVVSGNFSAIKKIMLAGILVVVGVAGYLSDSRSLLVSDALILASMAKLVPVRFINIITTLSLLAILVITTPLLFHFVPERQVIDDERDFPKSLREIMPLDRGTDDEINEFWRGHEARQAFKYMDARPYSYIFGTGLHSEVKIYLQRYGSLTAVDTPIFHNALAFLLFRGGSFGFLMYLAQLLLLGSSAQYLCKHEKDAVDLAYARMMAGIIVVCVATTPTTSGLINYKEFGATMSVFLGTMLFRFIQLRSKEEASSMLSIQKHS